MKPYLQPANISPTLPLEIEDSEYALLLQSRPILNAAFSFEENYDLLVGNYIELENASLTLTTESIVRQRHDYQDLFEVRAELNRRVVNFLSAARLFVDQLPQRIEQCGGSKVAVKSKLSAEYDASFEYRFMEALRNHVQHSGSAVHSLSIGGKWKPPRERKLNVFNLQAFTQKRFLLLDKTFKKSTLDECPDKVEVLVATRRYLESLSAVHDFARQHIEQPVDAARNAFGDAIHRYKAFSKESPIGLTAFPCGERDPSKGISVFLDWDEVRLKLSKRNRNLSNLSKSVVSSSTSEE
ncbi:hypothetical protein BH11PSE10_BH11PSE10_20980 [soil metagenome]